MDELNNERLTRIDAYLLRLVERVPNITFDEMARLAWFEIGEFLNAQDVIERLEIYHINGDEFVSLN